MLTWLTHFLWPASGQTARTLVGTCAIIAEMSLKTSNNQRTAKPCVEERD